MSAGLHAVNIQFYKDMEELTEPKTHAVLRGRCVTMEEYKHSTGFIEGVQAAVARHKELVEHMREQEFSK